MSSVIYSHQLTSLIIKYLLFRSPVIYSWFNWLFFHRLHSQKKWNIKIPNMQAKKCWQVNKCLKIKNKSQTKNVFVAWNIFRVTAIIYNHIHDNWVVEQKHKKIVTTGATNLPQNSAQFNKASLGVSPESHVVKQVI